MPCVIELKNVGFSAQGRTLVRNFSLGFEEGKTTAIVGPSGGGKSTVLKLAAGLFPPDEGEVLFREKDINRMNRQDNLLFRREAAFVFQDSALWANQNLFQILELPLRVHFPSMSKSERERRIESVVAEVGYTRELGVRPSQLSLGEQKLIAFSRAILCRPRLLYLDEWTESLDQNAAERLVEMVKDMRDNGVSIILVSHNMQIIRGMADMVIMIIGGRIVRKITKEQIDSDENIRRSIEKGMAS